MLGFDRQFPYDRDPYTIKIVYDHVGKRVRLLALDGRNAELAGGLSSNPILSGHTEQQVKRLLEITSPFGEKRSKPSNSAQVMFFIEARMRVPAARWRPPVSRRRRTSFSPSATWGSSTRAGSSARLGESDHIRRTTYKSVGIQLDHGHVLHMILYPPFCTTTINSVV